METTEKKTPRKRSRSMIGRDLNFTAAEAYKLLRTNLLFAIPGENRCRIIGVTSAVRSEGKSLTAVNLSYTLAETGKRVLIIDSDMRLPTMAKKLGLAATPGLSNVLAGLNPISEAVQYPDARQNWAALPAGDVPPNPSELLGSQRMRKLLERLSERFDFIIIDLPPVNIVADALVVSPWIDGIIMVVRENYSDRQSVAMAISQMEPMKEKLLGFVYNGASDAGRRYGKYKHYGKYYKSGYGYGYGYDRGYAYGKKKASSKFSKKKENGDSDGGLDLE